MTQILGLKASPLQTFTANDPNGGGVISFTLYFRPRVQSWFMDISFKTFSMNGYRLCRSPNALWSYSNIIPFGLVVSTTDILDPFLINDFTSGRVILALLTSDEVAEVDANINDGTITG
jgi:hypothetical protein